MFETGTKGQRTGNRKLDKGEKINPGIGKQEPENRDYPNDNGVAVIPA